MLTWLYFTDRASNLAVSQAPEFIKFVDSYDTWKFKNNPNYWGEYISSNTLAVNAYLSSIPKTLDAWSEVATASMSAIITAGNSILSYRNILIEGAVASAYPMNILGYAGLATNARPELAALIGNTLAEESGFGLVWSCEKYVINCSLRSVGDFDVSDIAKHYGGGGHNNAAGFSIPIRYITSLTTGALY